MNTPHEPLRRAADAQQQCNRAEAARAAACEELLAGFEADHGVRASHSPFTLGPAVELGVEAVPLTGLGQRRLRDDALCVRHLRERLPDVLGLVEAGRFDLFRARVVTDPIGVELEADRAAQAAYATRMNRWLATRAEQLEPTDPGAPDPILPITLEQLRRKVRAVIKAVRQADAEREFRRHFANRRVEVTDRGDGMGWLDASHDIASLKTVDQRLTQLAKSLRQDGDSRTLAQLRADLLVDLLMGRFTVTEDGEMLEHRLGRWGRPVINLTVPWTTAAGLSDDPGVLNGVTHIPAALARAITQDPDSTWYRLLTDPATGLSRELSTTSYRPSSPIARQVRSDWPTCYAPGCDRPASDCELDHSQPWPDGTTSVGNLTPACVRHHHAKHLPGARLEPRPNGTWRLLTRAGFSHVIQRPEQPVPETPVAATVVEAEYSATEIAEAVEYLHHLRDSLSETLSQRMTLEQLWADYRASYPDADDETVAWWVHFDDEHFPPDINADSPPPITQTGVTPRVDRALAELALPRTR